MSIIGHRQWFSRDFDEIIFSNYFFFTKWFNWVFIFTLQGIKNEILENIIGIEFLILPWIKSTEYNQGEFNNSIWNKGVVIKLKVNLNLIRTNTKIKKKLSNAFYLKKKTFKTLIFYLKHLNIIKYTWHQSENNHIFSHANLLIRNHFI